MSNSAKFVSSVDPAFCIIAPTSYLDQYATQSSTHLVLAHLVDTNDAYANFYKVLSQAYPDQRIIMDNSAFEKGASYEPTKLVELGHKCGAHALVLPDYPKQPCNITIEAAVKWAPLFRGEGFATMFVPQSLKGEREDWIDGYRWATDSDLVDIIGMSILGIPNALPHVPPAYARVVMTELLLDRNMFADKYHHYLGLNAAPNVELPTLLMSGVLHSCDSSNPVWAGINGFRYNTMQDSFMPVAKRFLREVDFDEERSKKNHIHETIQYNLDITLDIFKNPSSYVHPI